MDGPYIEPINVGFTMCHGFSGLWVRVMGVMMGTPNLDWILAQVGRPYEEEAAERGISFYDVIAEHVKKLEIGAGGVVYHPYLSASGERAPFVKPTARAQFFGITATHNWWLFRRLMDLTKGDPIASLPGYYDERNPVVRSYFDELESSFEQEVPEIIERAQRIGGNDKNKRAEVFDQFTAQCVKRVVSILEKLLHDFSS